MKGYLPTTAKKHLQCGVVGTGIAGLGAAFALRRAGPEIEIFEVSSFKQEIGATITMTPNANLVLDHWGFEAKKAAETKKCEPRRLNASTLGCTGQVDLHDVGTKFGHNFNAFHRIDVHHGMKEITLSHDQPWSVPKIELGREVVDLDCDKGMLQLKDGSQVHKHLTLIAGSR